MLSVVYGCLNLDCKVYIEHSHTLLEEVPMKIVQDQVPLKIHSKSGAFNIIMEIPLKASATEHLKKNSVALSL